MRYETRQILRFGLLPLLAGSLLSQQPTAVIRQIPVHLQVEAGTPLRLYITRRVSYRMGEAVQAKLLEPVWVFDRVVIPAGTTVQGRVVKLDPVSKMARAQAIFGGDFTPLKHAGVAFTSLALPDGRSLPIQSAESMGLHSFYIPPKPPKKPKKQQNTPSAKPGRVRQFLQQQAQNQASAGSYNVFSLVRAPSRREWVEDYLLSRLPYHPQFYRSHTRFDALLSAALDFGTVEVASSEFAKPGTPAPPDSTAEMRMLTSISSSGAHVGDPMHGVLSQPVFTAEHTLLLPQGTLFDGPITLARRARLWHRGGRLRFVIEQVDVPEHEAVASDVPAAPAHTLQPTQAQLAAVEPDATRVKVDSEGTATATESKSRLVRPAIAALVAMRSLDNDAGRQTASGSSGSNAGGRALGGFSGLGLLGMAAARGPRPVGVALGFYGLAWSVYWNVISRGSEVTFQQNAPVAIRFGATKKR